MKILSILTGLLAYLLGATLVIAEAHYPSKASDKERQALDRLASEIEGAVIYTTKGRVKKVTIGDWRAIDLGDGDYVRWGPLGKRIAVQHRGALILMNADGSDRKTLVKDGVSGGDGCMVEFHTNGREILYGTKRKGTWSVDIASRKTRDMKLPFSSELNISADGRHLVGRRSDCFLVELPGTKVRKYAGGCSPCVSPDGMRMTSNKGGHRTMDIQAWNGKRLLQINTKDLKPDGKWDNMHWSNHNDFIGMQGDGRQDETYAFRISTNLGTRLSWSGRTKYPDLFVTKDLKTGEVPMEQTIAWAEAKGTTTLVAKTKSEEKKSEEKPKEPMRGDQRVEEVRALTGSPTRVVWCQSKDKGRGNSTGNSNRLVGFGTEDGKGERFILSDVSSYAKPIFTPDGERIVYSNRSNRKMYVVNWDGSNRKELGEGYASDVWRDPSDGVFWLYYRSGDGREKAAVFRQQLDNPKKRERIWDHTPTGHKSVPWFRLSADGTHFADAFPWSKCGVGDPANGKWEQYSKGCWPSLAPDNSYRFFVFRGNHREIVVYDPGKKNSREVNVANVPGINRKDEMYYPRWSNDTRFLTVTGPRNKVSEDVFLGRFDSGFNKVEKWVRISKNDRQDHLGDAWIKSGWDAKLKQEKTPAVVQKEPAVTKKAPEPAESAKFSKQGEWPGDQRDLVFLWENGSATNQLQGDGKKAGRLCEVVARGRSVFGRFNEMDLGGGSMLAQDVDSALLDACKRSHALTIEATITPANITQDGPARIVTFSNGSSARNFTLGQEKDTLILRLRTPEGDSQQLDLCKIQAGRTVHIVTTYRSGEVTCHVDGKAVLKSNHIRGDFSNWQPMHLLFGDEWDGGRDWSGTMEGVAIYARAVSGAEAKHKYSLYSKRLSDRQPLERLVVEATLLERTPTPTEEALKEYHRGIVIHSYEIGKVIAGKEDAKKIQVAHWALLDRDLVPETDQKKIGKVYTLHLEDYARHSQLEAERTFNDCEDFDIPIYYDIAGRGVDAPPVLIAQAKPRIHLKVNCAGPTIDDWQSDKEFLDDRNRGKEFRFKKTANLSSVSNPAPVKVYHTVRHQEHGYAFDIPNGEYLVRLHFTDDYDDGGNKRKMDFVIENERALKGFNIVKAAGGTGKAVVREFSIKVSDSNGLQIRGEDPNGGDVFAAGIEIVSR